MEQLCTTYWYPLYAYVRRRGYSPEDAKDLTQAFFHHLLESDGLSRVDRQKGKFRAFLLASLTHFLINQWQHANAKRRGGGKVLVSMDEEAFEDRYTVEASRQEPLEMLFDRQWAFTVLRRAMALLQDEFKRAGKVAIWQSLNRFLTQNPNDGDYALIGRELRMQRTAVAMAVSRLRRRFRQLVREEVAQTLMNPADLDGEMDYLLRMVSG